MLTVPFLDLKAQYAGIKDEVDAAIRDVVEQAAFAGGPFVTAFEEAFAAYLGVPHVIAVGSGTEALWFALLAAQVGPGDEVITAASTFIATAEAIGACGAIPVFVDVDPRFHTIDPDAVAAAITPRTKAIVPVHLYGQCCDMTPLLAIAQRHGLRVIEDACQAHGATYKQQQAGSLGDAGCFSFYPGKNLGAFGEAGAVATHDEALAAYIRLMRDHGQKRKYQHVMAGWNGRMDGIQGAVLTVKLRHLDAWNTRRREVAAAYRQRLQGIDGIVVPEVAPYAAHVWHIFPLRVPQRDTVLAAMQARGVACGIHYPCPLHLEPPYQQAARPQGSCPVAERLATTELSLPMFPDLQEPQIDYVVDTLRTVTTAQRRNGLNG